MSFLSSPVLGREDCYINNANKVWAREELSSSPPQLSLQSPRSPGRTDIIITATTFPGHHCNDNVPQVWAGRTEEREYLRKVSSHRELELEWSMLCQVSLTDWEHGPPPKIIVSDFNFFSKLGKIGLKKMLGGVGFPHWTFFSPGASFSQWTFQ